MSNRNLINGEENDDLEGFFDPIVTKLIKCSNIAYRDLLNFLPIRCNNDKELYIFSQWITLNAAIMSDIPPEKMDEYYMNHDFLLMKEHNFSTAAAVQFSQLRVQRFREYEEFHQVIESYLGGKPSGGIAIKFSRIVLTNLLGDEAINHLLSSGPMFPMVVLNILLRQTEYFETNRITIPRLI